MHERENLMPNFLTINHWFKNNVTETINNEKILYSKLYVEYFCLGNLILTKPGIVIINVHAVHKV